MCGWETKIEREKERETDREVGRDRERGRGRQRERREEKKRVRHNEKLKDITLAGQLLQKENFSIIGEFLFVSLLLFAGETSVDRKQWWSR